MGYEFYLDKMLLPITPSKLEIKIKNKNKTYDLINEGELLKTNKKPIQFIVTRLFPNKKSLYNTNIKVSLEDYTIKEDVKQGMDVVVTIKLKQYRDYGTKVCKVTIKQPKPEVKPQPVAKPVVSRPASPAAPSFDGFTLF